ncbi:sodium-coupled monocarboxylate transporter 2-like isoform X2 [Penaeus monodon]|uniref:sodium-coupled monocarboxylate transporter 2-like isoform X2 n=1 Tax=Penaeus monodon TaxID=6687 RepID=UPI0018A74348|nr:sodium-coupled monocarboxylate transporter 2-like isoform X2 [Penaeus monodon]
MASGLEEIVRFGTADYVVFVGLIATSLGIGVFHAFTGNRNPEDYLFGGRSMSVLPVSVSLLSSYISAIAVLGCPGETYGHGLQISMLSAGTVIGVLLATVIFLPVFYPLKMTSINEYLELRFRSRFLRLTIFLVQLVPTFVYSGLCLYAPTLAMASVTPLSVEANIIILGVVCFVYSAMGGLRAVVWTDVVQMAVVLAGTVSVVVVACVRVGGLEEVWKIAETADRTQLFDLSLNPYKRHTMANVMTMGAVLFLNSYGVSQTNLQRICAVPTIGQARRVLLMNLVGMVAMSILQDFSGICAFATYHGCDPLARGIITSKDQILPYFVMDQMGFIVGMPGLFVAMLYGGSLSLSSIINSWVAVVWTDLLEPLPWFRNVTRSGAAFINKILSLLMGLLIIAMAFFAKNFGGLFQTTMTLAGVAAGPTLGLYLTGVLVPYCDRRGAFAGLVVSATFLAWITLGASIYGSKPELLPFSNETCPGFYRDHGTNESLFKPAFPAEAPKMEAGFMDHAREVQAPDSATTANASLSENDNWGLMYLYGLSYTLFMTLGMVVFVAVASLVTLITGETPIQWENHGNP